MFSTPRHTTQYLDLPAGADRAGNPLDISRLHADTGYRPENDTVRAAAADIARLRAGHDR